MRENSADCSPESCACLMSVFRSGVQFSKVITRMRRFASVRRQYSAIVQRMGRFAMRRAIDASCYRLLAEGTNTQLIGYAAFFSPDNAPRIFFIHAEKRWRFCSRRTTASLVTQLN